MTLEEHRAEVRCPTPAVDFLFPCQRDTGAHARVEVMHLPCTQKGNTSKYCVPSQSHSYAESGHKIIIIIIIINDST
jgi:hypothetical protein